MSEKRIDLIREAAMRRNTGAAGLGAYRLGLVGRPIANYDNPGARD